MAQPSTTMSNPQFLMLGDSMVAGFNWQKRITNFTIRNYGVPGATTSALLHALPRIIPRYKKAEVVLVMIGTNDVAQENFSFLTDLRQIIITVTRECPTAELMVNSLLPMTLPHLGQAALPKVNEQIEDICRETGSCFVDVYSRFLQFPENLLEPDGVHINETGYELWARTLLEHIAFLVEND